MSWGLLGKDQPQIMESSNPKGPGSPESSSGTPHLSWILAAGLLVIAFLAVVLPRPKAVSSKSAILTNTFPVDHSGFKASAPISPKRPSSVFAAKSVKMPEEIVGAKLAKFAQSRRDLVYTLAGRHGVEVSDDVKRFFDAVESGNWDEIQASFKTINGDDSSAGHAAGRTPGVNEYWSAIIDAYGAAEQVHEWPAQKLLDYGNAILGSLRPGMVYIGGTDNGRWIPELLNDTSDGERHIIVTQNGLADGKYLEYVTELYSDKLTTLTQEDSQRAFQEYMSDAQKRLQHDQQFPDEPKQIRPGENIISVDGRVQVSGQVAVMQINERLLQMLMEKNPDRSFAIQESFPLKGTYTDAVPLGPLMELRATDGQNTFTADRAAQSVDLLRTTAENVLADPEASGSPTALKSYSHDATSTANLLAAHNFISEAEQAYRLSSQLWPGNPEAVGGLAAILGSTGHADQARQLLDDFASRYPDQRSAIETFRGSILWIVPTVKPSR